MSYTLPDEDMLKSIVRRVLRRKGVVESQSELVREVRKHLNHVDPSYRVSPRRVRLTAIEDPHIKLEIRYRLTDIHTENFEKCPVCGSKMTKVKNSTLDGKSVVIGFKCIRCPYWTGKRIRKPVRYIFRYV